MYECISNVLLKILNFLDRIFNRIYGSKINPLYQSGTLAVSLFIIAIFTGIYLLFWYSLSSPFESMQNIERHWLWARWVRNLHRYSSDLSVIAVALHVLRMFAERKTWGPRLLAWITGAALALLMFIVGWTGFVLVWDHHAQALVTAGAEMLGAIPFLGGAVRRTVSGAIPTGSSFFFLNLFLHMSLPLIMIALLWLHTSKLKQPAWIPSKPFFITLTAFTILISLLINPPLEGPADLLTLDQKYFLNPYFGFIIPIIQNGGPLLSLFIFSITFILFLFIPYYWRPKNKEIQIANHNPQACTGCQQCELDCPFDAIDMVPRTIGSGSDLVAQVQKDSCTGCGICSASCSQLAIGPKDKSSQTQMGKVKQLKKLSPYGNKLVIYCERNPLGRQYLGSHNEPPISYQVDCAGNLHVAAVYSALRHFSKVEVIACPPHACINRLGQERFVQRFLQARPPVAPPLMDFSKVEIYSGALCDLDELNARMRGTRSTGPNWYNRIRLIVATVLILSLFAILSSIPTQRKVDYSVLRLAIRWPPQAVEVCRDRTAEELQKLPVHMRSTSECTRTALDYQLNITIDGSLNLSENLASAGMRSDKPYLFEHELRISPGQHKIFIDISPKREVAGQTLRVSETFDEDFVSGRAILVTFNSNLKSLVLSKSAH